MATPSFNFFKVILLLVLGTLFTNCRNEPKDVCLPLGKIQSNLPIFYVETNEQEIKDEPKISATLKVSVDDSTLHQEVIAIEYKGKSSLRFSRKKSYNFEIRNNKNKNKKVSLLGFPEEEDWILTGNMVNSEGFLVANRSLLHHHLGFELFRRTGQYSPRTAFVEVIINDCYQGIYLLSEKIKEGKNRVPIKTKGNNPGFLIAIDKAEPPFEKNKSWSSNFRIDDMNEARYTNTNSFRSQYDINGKLLKDPPFNPPYHENKYLETYFVYQYPQPLKISEKEKKDIQLFIHDFETALTNENFSTSERKYLEFINVNSFVDYFLVNELCKNVDAFRLSTFMYKDSLGKLNMGPVWDFDIGFSDGERLPDHDWVINYNNHVEGDAWSMPFWWPKLMKDPLFRQSVSQKWKALRSNGWSDDELKKLVDNAAHQLTAKGAIQRNEQKWKVPLTKDYPGLISKLKTFLKDRAAWMDKTIATF